MTQFAEKPLRYQAGQIEYCYAVTNFKMDLYLLKLTILPARYTGIYL